MERQYIGARYVPKFFENPNTTDSAWLAGVAYEALTIVTYAGNSYTSKKPVPAGIGAPNANPDYWVATGLFNQQIESLRQATITNAQNIATNTADIATNAENIEDNTESIKDISSMVNAKRQFILIGDSYGGGIDGDNNTQTVAGGGWIQRCKDAVSGWAEVYNSQTPLGGVYGFASSRPFLDVLKSAEQNVPDKRKITDIIVLGGTNDVGINAATIIGKIQEFCTYVKANYPHARLAIGCLGAHIYDMVNMGQDAYSKCENYGAEYISDLRCLYGLKKYIGADGTHLNANGYAFYTPYINQAILTGHSYWRFTGSEEFSFNPSAPASKVSDLMFTYDLTNSTFKAGLTSTPALNYFGEAIITVNAGLNAGFYAIGSQNALQAVPVPYARLQALICNDHVFEIYMDPANVANLVVTSGVAQASPAKTGASLMNFYTY